MSKNFGISIRVVSYKIPEHPSSKPLNLIEWLWSAIESSHKCVVCGRSESFVKRWRDIGESSVVCGSCWGMNTWEES